MAENVKYQLRLLNLYCYRQDEGDGDEVFLKHDKKKLWPADSKYVKVKEGDYKISQNLDGIDKGTQMIIELWDYDFITPNDKLGEFVMLVNERGGPFKTDLKALESQDAKYSLEWEVY
jgi:hypothetical protein